MRRTVWLLLLVFVFTIPWEYSLDWGEPWGNIARLCGLAVLLAAAPTLLMQGAVRPLGAMPWAAVACFLWLATTCLWSIAPETSFAHLRGYAQEIMLLFLIWEFGESLSDLLWLMRAYLLGAWTLAALSLLDLALATEAEARIRFVASGQDPNDVARFLVLALPFAAYLFSREESRVGRLLAIGYLPVGVVAIALSGSRGGFLAALCGLAGCVLLLGRSHGRSLLLGGSALAAGAAGVWWMVPRETLQRIASLVEQLNHGDLNQRLSIWQASWRACLQAPLLGHGAGAFLEAVKVAPDDTAHNTVLSILVSAGAVGLMLATSLLALAIHAVARQRGEMRLLLASALGVWLLTSMASTVEESRSTWWLFGLIALAGRVADEAAVCGDAAESPELAPIWRRPAEGL